MCLADVPGGAPGQLGHGQSEWRRGRAGGARPHPRARVGEAADGLELGPAAGGLIVYLILMMTSFLNKPNFSVLVSVRGREHLLDVSVRHLGDTHYPAIVNSDCPEIVSSQTIMGLRGPATQMYGSYLHRQIPHHEFKVRFSQELLLNLVFPCFVLIRKGFCSTQDLTKVSW